MGASPSGAWSSRTTPADASPAPPRAREWPAEAVGRVARWMLVVIAADLVVTRFLVRLAMFIPKEGPLVTLAAAGGRVAAVTDTLVVVMGLLLLGVLLARAWHGAPGGALASVLATGLAAAAGFALLWVAPTPMLVALAGSAVVVAAVTVGALAWRTPSLTLPGRAGVSLLGVAIGCAGLRAVLGVAGVGVAATTPGSSVGVVVAAVGEAAFVGGAAVVGASGLVAARRAGDQRLGRWLVLGAVVSGVMLMAWLRAPSSWESLMIWSIGLTEAVPVPVSAVVAGVAVAGLLASRVRTPRLACGVAIALLAGSGLSASGLVLAGLLGLLVATTDDDERAVDAGGAGRDADDPDRGASSHDLGV